jgi:hypothetical protein
MKPTVLNRRLDAAPVPAICNRRLKVTSILAASVFSTRNAAVANRRHGPGSLSAPILWVLLFGLLLLPLSAAEPQNTSAIAALKPGPGREQVQINCIPCHSTAIITATHATRERWDELITMMQQKHGLWPIVPTIRKQLLDYLAATQPPSDPGLEAGKQTPWAQPLYRPNPLW